MDEELKGRLAKVKEMQRELFDIIIPYKIDVGKAPYYQENREEIERSVAEYFKLEREREGLVKKLGGREYRFSDL